MTKKRKDAVRKMNAKIHENTINWAKKMAEKRREKKQKQKEGENYGMDITNNN